MNKALAKRYSKLKPSYTIKATIGGWPNGTAKSSQLARKPFSCLTTTAQSPTIAKQLGSSWPRWPNDLAQVGRKFEFDQIQAKLDPTQAKWVTKRNPTSTMLKTWLELAWVESTVWPGLNVGMNAKVLLSCILYTVTSNRHHENLGSTACWKYAHEARSMNQWLCREFQWNGKHEFLRGILRQWIKAEQIILFSTPIFFLPFLPTFIII